MPFQARPTLALIIALLLLLPGVVPAAAISAVPPNREGSAPTGLKHPVLDSALLRMVRQSRAGAASADVAREAPVSAGSSVAVTIRTTGAADKLVAALAGAGADVANVGAEMVEAYVPVDRLFDVALVPGVVAVQQIVPPVPRVTSQGAALHGATAWNTAGYTGAGVKLGVIDVGFEGYTDLIGREVPTPVARCYDRIGNATSQLSYCENGEVHGTAVTETIVDLAPQAQIYIANPQSPGDLFDAIDWMAAQGVTIVNHSVGWMYEGPGDGTSVFSDGPLAAVDRAIDHGITWVNAAGNEGQSTWTGPFTDVDADGYLEFEPGVERNGVVALDGLPLTFQMRWDDAWGRAARDIDLYLVAEDDTLVWSSEQEQNGSSGDYPFEAIMYTAHAPGILYLKVRALGSDLPSWLELQEFSGWPLELSSPVGTVGNPAESANPGLLAVGAAAWETPDAIEYFSSQGPTRDGRVKPDVVGYDRADTVSYGTGGFAGTSQASPHVAALATLVKQRYPSFGPAELASYIKANAAPRGSVPNNVWGWGVAQLPPVDAGNPVPAIENLSPPYVRAGTQPVTLTVNGASFIDGSVVRVNGADRPTSFVSSTQLRAELEASDTAAEGNLTVTVFTPGPGGGLSNAVTFAVTGDVAPDNAAFQRTWERTDKPVKDGAVPRTWMWGDGAASTPLYEDYAEGQGGQRVVKYYDKSRMEVTDPHGDPNSPWYVTNGLLVLELMTGRMQVGDALFEPHDPAQVNVAGDADDPTGPTYATFDTLRDAEPLPAGAVITQRVDRNGVVTNDPSLAAYGVTTAQLVSIPGIEHQIAAPFWAFMNSAGLVWEDGQLTTDYLFENAFYATGYPVTEAYWARVKVAGVYHDVLMQCFERRCLTFTPGNPEGWRVEAGNVGLHYYFWRYGSLPALVAASSWED